MLKHPLVAAALTAVAFGVSVAIVKALEPDRSASGAAQAAGTLNAGAGDYVSPALAASGESGVVGRNSFEREGLRVGFGAGSATADSDRVVADDIASLKFTIKNADGSAPVSGLYPAAWIDPIEAGTEITDEMCREKAGLYLRGLVGVRPMVDLNSYYIVVLNDDPSIAIIDPIIGIRGITKLLTQIALPGRANDWARSADEKDVFVTIPSQDAVAVVSMETFRLKQSVEVGDQPTRAYVQPDGRYLWVGHGGRRSGVTVVDTHSLEVVGEIVTGRGHHEIVVDDANRYAYVTNRDDNTVSIISVRDLALVDTIRTTGTPVDVAYSPLSEAVYVTNGDDGEIIVLDKATNDTRATIGSSPGVGPLSVSQDGRWIMTVNTFANQVVVVDSATNQIAHEIEIPGKPFHLAFSRKFAYIRSLDNAKVSMIQLDTLASGAEPIVMAFDAGTQAPSKTQTLLPANLFATAVTEAALLAVSPSDATVFYYMEGMNAPMGSFRNYGHRPMSVLIADRTIKETGDGVYTSSLKIPAAGDYMVIMTLDSPEMIECFRFRAEPNPNAIVDDAIARVTYITRPGSIMPVGKPSNVQFRIETAQSGAELPDTIDVLTYRAPNTNRTIVKAHRNDMDVYELDLTAERDGVYYAYPSIPSLGLKPGDLDFLTLIARADAKRTAG